MAPESPETPERRRFLLTNLGILSVFILTLLVLLAAYPTLLAPPPTATFTPSPPATLTPVPSRTPTITLTPTQTRTLRPALTATPTLTPSITPTPSQTPTLAGPPTLTPARPLEGSPYNLHEWSPEEAQRLIDLMEDYPNTLPRQERGVDNENYYAAFSYAVAAESEAILRFPDVPQAKTWRWRLAYNLARTDDPRASSTYADLIGRGLNSSEVKSVDLPGWFALQEPRLQLKMVKIPAPSGYLNAYLLSLANAIEPPVGGSVHLLLLETPGAYEVLPLEGEFNFLYEPKAPSRPVAELSGAPQTTSFNADLTGDDLTEIAIFPTNPGESFLLVPPAVFSLAQVPPQQLPFNPALSPFDLGTDFINNWSAVDGPSGVKDLQFSTTVFPACPVQVVRTYRWSGEWFDLVEESYTAQPNPGTLSFCQLVANHAANAWGPAAAIGVMEPVLPEWPPEVDENGEPYPAEARDEWRYRLGVYHALAGNPEKARDYFNQVIASPAATGSRWVDLAQAFLQAYQSPNDLYRACTGAEFCDPRWALRSEVARLPADAYPRALTSLWATGVAQRSSGYFDFDGDGQTETWFLVRHRPGEKLEFWILTPTKDHIEALFVSEVESDRPQLDLYDPEAVPPVVIVDGTLAFTLQRLPGSQQPYLTWPELPQFYPNRFNQAVQQAMDALFSGTDPAEVQADLIQLQVSPGLLCEALWSCDQYFYILGLASELAGDQETAVDAYLRLWWDYSKSPYTSLARLKLEGAAVQPSATPSPTGAPTNATPPSPTVSGTPATLTPTVTGTPPTATSTLGTPGVTPTEVLTPTPPTPYP